MKALMYMGPNNMPLTEVDEPEPKEYEVKIKVHYCGICGSDIHGYTGASGRKIPPMIMGHELSGQVVATGKKVAKFGPGDRVAVQPVMYCGACEFCRSGNMNICKNRRGLGVLDVNGAFTEYLCMEEKYVYLLPDSVSDYAGAVLEPLSVAYHAVGHVASYEGKTVLIAGAGTIGFLILKLVLARGAKAAIVTDLSGERLLRAQKAGASLVVNPAKESLDEKLKAAGLRDEIDIAIECVGVTQTAQQTVEFVKIKGTVIWVGNADKLVTVNMQQVVTREVSVLGTYAFTENDFAAALKMLADGVIHVDDVVTDVVAMEDTEKKIAALSAGACPGDLKVLVKVGG